MNKDLKFIVDYILVELSGGPYQPNLAPSYITMMRVAEVNNMPYVNLAMHHMRCGQAPGHMTGYVFDQILPPVTWNGRWWGCAQVVHVYIK